MFHRRPSMVVRRKAEMLGGWGAVSLRSRKGGRLTPRALSIGAEAFCWLSETPGTGTVIGIHRYSVAWADPANRLLMLGNRGMGRLPQGILLDIPASVDFRSLGVDVGQTVEASAEQISAAGGRIMVRLPADTVWTFRRPPFRTGASKRAVARNIESARQILVEGNHTEGLISLLHHLDVLARGRCPNDRRFSALCRSASQPVADLALAIREGDARRLARAAERLFGLGIGLTPSGDDVLVGALAISVIFGSPLGHAAKELASRARGRTTRISESFLELAARGAIAEVIGNFISAVVAGGLEDVGEAAQRLKRFGSTSGRETGLGALLALTALLEAMPADAVDGGAGRPSAI